MTAHESLLHLASPNGERLTLSPWGAQVLTWHDAAGRPLLYLSPLAPAAGGARRGGIPVCFPQFSGRGPLPKHGFARSSTWTVEATEAGSLRLRLTDSPASRALWPHRFALVLTATLSTQSLAVALEVRNEDDHAWDFTGALHTYLHVGDVARTQLQGLAGLTYEDALDDCVLKPAEAQGPDLSLPIDRVYRQAQGPLTLRTPGHVLQITQAGFEDVVVWNPGERGAQALADLPDADHRQMLCVEAAQAARPRTLQPGETWHGSQTLRQVAA